VDDLMRCELVLQALVGRVRVGHDARATVYVIADDSFETVGGHVRDVRGAGTSPALDYDHDRSLAFAAAEVLARVLVVALLPVASLATDVGLVGFHDAGKL